MQASAELRWFIRGRVPSAVAGWFNGGDVAAQTESARQDIYFNLLGVDSLSIKLREGKLDIKQRRADLGIQNLRYDVNARIEEWVKWSFAIDKNKASDITSEKDWLSIWKSRQLKKYEVTMKDDVRSVDAADQIDQGCNLELTDLIVNRQTWWTLAFEAFGKMDRVEKNLRLVLARVLSDRQFPPMRAEHSYGYPRWLGLILGHGAKG